MSSSYDSAFIVAERAIFTKHLEICLDGMNDGASHPISWYKQEYKMCQHALHYYLEWLGSVFTSETPLDTNAIVGIIAVDDDLMKLEGWTQ
jgi:hypothetical protein